MPTPAVRRRFARVLVARRATTSRPSTAADAAVERCRAAAARRRARGRRAVPRRRAGAAGRAQGRRRRLPQRGRAARAARPGPRHRRRRRCARGVQDFLVEPIGDAELVARVEAAGRTKVLQEELVVQSAAPGGDALRGPADRALQPPLHPHPARRARSAPPAATSARCRSRSSTSTTSRPSTTRTATPPATACWRPSPRALREHLRAEDQLGRLGGEEFLALLPDADAAPRPRPRPRSCAPRSPRWQVEHDGADLAVTVSIGWATWEGESAEELLRRADEALYEAKRAGRDRVEGAPATVQRRT